MLLVRKALYGHFCARYDYPRDLQGNIDIALHRSTDKGVTWQPIQTVLDMGEWGRFTTEIQWSE